MTKTVGGIKRLIRKIRSDYGHKYDVEFGVIGFGGAKIRKEPHIQTGGGKIFTDYAGAATAIDNLRFDGKKMDRRYDAQTFYVINIKIIEFVSW